MATALLLNGNRIATQYLPIAYGSFSSTQTQAAPTTLVYDTEDITPYAVSATLPSANIVVANAGVYKVLVSLQCDKTTPLVGDLEMWVNVGGVAVPNSATRSQINQNQEVVMSVEWFLELNANDSVSISISSIALGLQAVAFPAAPPVPAIPSIITTILRIR